MRTDTSSPVLVTKDVILARNDRPFAALPDLDVRAGDSIAIVGASGCGKTTALLALSGIRAPAGGEILIERASLWTLSPRKRDRLRGRRIGLVFQSFHLIDALSVAQNLDLAARCAGLSGNSARRDHLLQELGIATLCRKRADRISHGQAQRVAVARALFNKPAIVLADEPTSALDDATAVSLLALLKETARAEGAALVIATHDQRVLSQVGTIIEMESVA